MKVTRELLKSILLVTLVLSSVVLTYMNLFNGLLMSDQTSDMTDASSSNLAQYINPQSFFISFGGLSYTKVYDLKYQAEIWTSIQPFIESCFMNFESINEIDKTEYIKAFSNKSLLIRMPLSLSVDDFLSLYSDKSTVSSTLKITPKEYIIREGNERSLYVFDELNNKYYHLTNRDQAHEVEALIQALKNQEPMDYRKISTRFSLESTVEEKYNQLNYELIPVEHNFIISSLAIENEVSLEDDKFTQEVSAISNAIFGNRLDFVKKLKDVNESTILMYGYGDKSLTVTQEGLILYRKKLDHTSAVKTNFKEAFALAVGRIENFGVIPDGLYLENYDFNKETNTHQFYFNYKLNNYSIAQKFKKDSPLIIAVQENQVVAVDKNIKIFAGEQMSALYDNTDHLYAVDKCINDNSLEIVVYYLQDNDVYEDVLDPMDYYFPIRSEIDSIELKYLEENDGYQTLMIPIWQVVINSRTYLFNAYTGDLLTTYQ